MNLSWVNAYMYGIDLRGAVMEGLVLSSRDDLAHSYLQCADLAGAHLQGAHMEGADLRGADLSGADLQGTYLAGADLQGADINGANFSGARDGGAKVEGMYGTAVGLPSGVVPDTTAPPSQLSCLADKNYWDQPKATPTPTASPPAPSPPATPSN
jgi:hypothetical protein